MVHLDYYVGYGPSKSWKITKKTTIKLVMVSVTLEFCNYQVRNWVCLNDYFLWKYFYLIVTGRIGGEKCLFFEDYSSYSYYSHDIYGCDGSKPWFDGGCRQYNYTTNQYDPRLCRNYPIQFACRQDGPCSNYIFSDLVICLTQTYTSTHTIILPQCSLRQRHRCLFSKECRNEAVCTVLWAIKKRNKML